MHPSKLIPQATAATIITSLEVEKGKLIFHFKSRILLDIKDRVLLTGDWFYSSS